MLDRIRLAMDVGSLDKFGGVVDSAEAFIRGKAKNMHKARRERLSGDTQTDKTAVIGILERGDGTTRAGSALV